MQIDMRASRWSRPDRIVVAAIAAMLAVPVVAMRFTDEVAWSATDFIVAAALLLGGFVAFRLLTRHARGGRRALIGAGLASVVALIWAQGAIGVF